MIGRTVRSTLATLLFAVALPAHAQEPWLPQDVTYSLGGGDALLSWSPVPEAEGYLVHRDGEHIDGTSRTQYAVSGFDDRSVYQVSACFGIRCLELSQPAVPATPAGPVNAHASMSLDETLEYQVRAARDSDEIARLRRLLIAADIDPDAG